MSNRDIVILRVEKEMIGPGSDIFFCQDSKNNSDEVIGDKPLSRYFSGILFPKQNGLVEFIDNDDENEETPLSEEDYIDSNLSEEQNDVYGDTVNENENDNTYSANTFFPSQYGLSFMVSKECEELDIVVSFGNYRKAKYNEVALPYSGESIELITKYSLDNYVEYDSQKRLLIIKKELSKSDKQNLSLLARDYRDNILYKTLRKLFFKDKYKRYDNIINFVCPNENVINAENRHYKVLLSSIDGVCCKMWWKSNTEKLSDNLFLHVKLYDDNDNYIVKVFIENTLLFPKRNFSLAKESLNQACLFQTKIQVKTDYLRPFNSVKNNIYRTEEDRMSDYLFRRKLSYGIGHNTSCIWENCENDNITPKWISTTFLPEYNVKSQSTDIHNFDKKYLDIKELSSFSSNDKNIVSYLQLLADSYYRWIENECIISNNDLININLSQINIDKCYAIHKRIQKGIELIEKDTDVLRAFQLANAAIYLQMFQNEKHFSKNDGFEAFEERELIQYSYNEYKTIDYPNINKKPCWRPFQLAFILQCIPSLVDGESDDRDIVDLLYFPTGGGKTEAYLALSAFLIFWRRIRYPKNYGGINIIIRYTLRLLSAQQFERATKLILACEFIRRNNSDLGTERITIGFWVGNSTIPNKRDDAKVILKDIQKKINKNKNHNNPFQLSNCQWCNTKIISPLYQKGNISIGHRLNRQNNLDSFCLNPKCEYSENKGGFPIVLIDEDIYDNPPTMLFATVDKLAQLAWKDNCYQLFNGNNRKPELIIQDELHLLNGTLGSMVGLFENVVISLCTDNLQKPKIIASTATIKNVDNQVSALYNRKVQVFPQNATDSDSSFFSKQIEESKRRYIGILPTGKTQTMTNLRLNAALLLSRLEIWEQSVNKKDVDQFWTILSYYKSLKHIGRFSNKIVTELLPEIKQLQVRYLKNIVPLNSNYNKIPYRFLELTSRIPNEKIKKNLDKLNIQFDGDIKNYQSYDIVLATNMISVGLDVGRLGIMIMNSMPMNTAEYIQASSRVARKNEGVVFTLFDSNNSRDLSFFEDFVHFHKTFYKQVEPVSITPFAENALNKLLFTCMIAYYRHKKGFYKNNLPSTLTDNNNETELKKDFYALFENHVFADCYDKMILKQKIEDLIQEWKYKIESKGEDLYYCRVKENSQKGNLMISLNGQSNRNDILVGMESMRSVEANVEINVNNY